MTLLATMTSPGGLAWDLTDEDALWMARSIVGESVRDASAVASTMLRRLAYVSDRQGRRVWGSLTELLIGTDSTRGYSQPVSIYWRERGTAAQQARRASIRSLGWEEIPASVRATVTRLFTGAPLAVPGAIHFADTRLSAEFIQENPGSSVVWRGANVFIAMAGSRAYRDPARTPTPAGLALANGQRVPSLVLFPIVLSALAAKLALAVLL